MGRANRLLAPRVTAIATELRRRARRRAEARRQGDVHRQSGAAGGDRGGRDALCRAGARRARAAAGVRRQPGRARSWRTSCRRRSSGSTRRCARGSARPAGARGGSRRACGTTYARLGIAAEVAPFFSDLPARIAAAHLVVSRSGAGTVAELAAIGRPVDPGAAARCARPGPVRQCGRAGEGAAARSGCAQEAFTPERLASEITALASAPEKLVAMAAGRPLGQGTLDAAERLADLVVKAMHKSRERRTQA